MKFENGMKYWAQVFLLPIYWFSYLTPRSKNIWLLGSSFGKRFADNPKYFYLYLSQMKKDKVRPIWISQDRDIVDMLRKEGYEAYKARTPKAIWYCLRGGVYIFDNYSKDISFWLSGGAKKVNLWHGVGNKKINYDNRFDTVRHPKNRFESFKTYLRRLSDEKPSHYILATSPIMAKIFASAFRVDMSHVIVEGYPRNDALISDKIKNIYSTEEVHTIKTLQDAQMEDKKIIFYMPTFRPSETMFFDVMDVAKFNEFLVSKNYMFCTKLHPKSKLKEQFDLVNYSNIMNISSDVDSYGVLSYGDMLVTDYSSIYSDYLMLNRPSVLFPYDMEEYSTNTRDCYFEYEDYMKDVKAYDMAELMDSIEKAFAEDTCESGRLHVRGWMYESADGKSNERLYHRIVEILHG